MHWYKSTSAGLLATLPSWRSSPKNLCDKFEVFPCFLELQHFLTIFWSSAVQLLLPIKSSLKSWWRARPVCYLVWAAGQRLTEYELNAHRWLQKPMTLCSVLKIVGSTGLGKWLFPCTWHGWEHILNTVLSFGLLTRRSIWSCWRGCREQWSWWRDEKKDFWWMTEGIGVV